MAEVYIGMSVFFIRHITQIHRTIWTEMEFILNSRSSEFLIGYLYQNSCRRETASVEMTSDVQSKQ